MEVDFKKLIDALASKPFPSKLLSNIIDVLDQQTSQSSATFIQQSIEPLVALKHWSWQQLSNDSRRWIYQPNYFALFHSIASFNRNMIFIDDEQINNEIKISLLIPDSHEQINGIFEQIHQITDDNSPFLIIVNHWFDNLSFLIREQPHFDRLPAISYLNEYLSHDYLMTDQFHIYLTELLQPQIDKSIYTARQLFYMKTCPFSLSSYLSANAQTFPFTANQMFEHIGEEYLQMAIVHSQTIESWTDELCCCIAHLTGLISACCWWGGEKLREATILFPTERILCDFVQALIRIITYERFYQEIQPNGCNNETILINVVLKLILFSLNVHKMTWFFRDNPTVIDHILIYAENSVFEENFVCAYAILVEVLTDEKIKDLQIKDEMSVKFSNILTKAWQHPLKKYRNIPIAHLLRGFLSLTKSDAIKQKLTHQDNLSLLIQMSDEYPIVYDILWAASFNQNVQQRLRSNSQFMSKLKHLARQCENEQIRKMTHGLLWNLEIDHKDPSAADINSREKFEIMISYSHKDKILCTQIYEELIKAGHRVWIDFDQMHGNVMDAMAQAIEQSQTVIICLSEDYRKSNYCRAEAQYAFQRQRKILPVLLQKHYKPDGWLLFLIGQLLYVDFTKHEFARAIEMLFKELKGLDTAHVVPTIVQPKPNGVVSLPKLNLSPILPPNISDWSEAHVQSWLTSHHFDRMPELLRQCNGPTLIHLNEYIKNGDTNLILNLLQDESLEKTGQTLCLTELSRFQSLMNDQTQMINSTSSMRTNQSDRRADRKGCCSCCLMM